MELSHAHAQEGGRARVLSGMEIRRSASPKRWLVEQRFLASPPEIWRDSQPEGRQAASEPAKKQAKAGKHDQNEASKSTKKQTET